jgi:hypothetical protein
MYICQMLNFIILIYLSDKSTTRFGAQHAEVWREQHAPPQFYVLWIRIWGSQSGGCEDYYRLGCNAIYFGDSPTLLRNIFPPSSGMKLSLQIVSVAFFFDLVFDSEDIGRVYSSETSDCLRTTWLCSSGGHTFIIRHEVPTICKSSGMWSSVNG